MNQAKQGFNRHLSICTEQQWAWYLDGMLTDDTQEVFSEGYVVLYSRMPYWGGTPGKVIAEKHMLPNGTTEYFIPTYAIGV